MNLHTFDLGADLPLLDWSEATEDQQATVCRLLSEDIERRTRHPAVVVRRGADTDLRITVEASDRDSAQEIAWRAVYDAAVAVLGRRAR